MEMQFVDLQSGRVLHTSEGYDRSSVAVGDRVRIFSDQQFGRKIEISGQIVALTHLIFDVEGEPRERRLIATVSTD